MANKQDPAKNADQILHGNKARVPKDKQVTPLYLTNTVTMSDTKGGRPPVAGDENVEAARRFSKENQL